MFLVHLNSANRYLHKPGDTTDLREWMRTFCSVSANMSSRAELSGPRVVSSSLHIGKKSLSGTSTVHG
jgi:hypothetical protein